MDKEVYLIEDLKFEWRPDFVFIQYKSHKNPEKNYRGRAKVISCNRECIVVRPVSGAYQLITLDYENCKKEAKMSNSAESLVIFRLHKKKITAEMVKKSAKLAKKAKKQKNIKTQHGYV